MDSLNVNENEALRILWDSGEQKPAEIQSAFSWEIENATLRSTLMNLVDKGLVSRRKVGKAFFYKPRTRKSTQFVKAMERMAEIFTGGSTRGLIMELLRQEELTDEDLTLLQELANQKRSKKKR